MNWYEEDVKKLEQQTAARQHKEGLLFYGSSSIRQWEGLAQDFPQWQPVNLGFGGSTLAACVWFFERILLPYRPQALVVYAGDNDLGDGRHPEEVCIFYQQLSVKTRQHFGDIPLVFISVKPSIRRYEIMDKIRYTNTLVSEVIAQEQQRHFVNIFNSMLDKDGHPVWDYFEGDGLHLSVKGYALWKNILQQQLPLWL
jgi:lysophospholipase L1-like esterase